MAQMPYDNPTARPDLLARVIDDQEARPPWLPEEMAAILRHQLAASVLDDLRAAGMCLDALPPSQPPIQAFGDLFTHPRPPLELLRRVKAFGKRFMDDPAGAVPPEVASVLYYGCIIVARARLGCSITRLDDATLRQSVQRILAEPWLDPSMVVLFRQALSSTFTPA